MNVLVVVEKWAKLCPFWFFKKNLWILKDISSSRRNQDGVYLCGVLLHRSFNSQCLSHLLCHLSCKFVSGIIRAQVEIVVFLCGIGFWSETAL